MFTAGLAAVASNAYVPVLIILILSCIIGLQAAHRERVAARKARSKDE
jgi:nucleoside phosphorylase